MNPYNRFLNKFAEERLSYHFSKDNADELECIIDFIHKVEKRIVKASVQILQYKFRKTISSQAIQTVIRTLLPDDIECYRKELVKEGCLAVTKYNSSIAGSSEKNKKSKKKIVVPMSTRTGLLFPINALVREMKEIVEGDINVSKTAAVYLGAVIEYIVGIWLTSSIEEMNRRSESMITCEMLSYVMEEGELSVIKSIFTPHGY